MSRRPGRKPTLNNARPVSIVLGQEHSQLLDELSASQKRSRSEIIRDALDHYVREARPAYGKEGGEDQSS